MNQPIEAVKQRFELHDINYTYHPENIHIQADVNVAKGQIRLNAQYMKHLEIIYMSADLISKKEIESRFRDEIEHWDNHQIQLIQKERFEWERNRFPIETNN